MNAKHYLIDGGKFYYQGQFVEGLALEINNHQIVSVKSSDNANNKLPRLTLKADELLIPAFIDLHIHGSNGYDVMDASTESLEEISQSLLNQGVSGFLATTMTAEAEQISEALIAVKKAHKLNKIPNLLGIHLEGPFISSGYMGAQPQNFIQEANLETYKNWQQQSGNMIRQITIAPEIKGASELISVLSSESVILSAGHSGASCLETKKAFELGISHITHLYNAMTGMHHRSPGLALAVLLDDTVSAELIADGIHLSPEIIKLTIKVLGKERIVLVTDAMRAQGVGDGKFQLSNQTVTVRGNEARLDNGVLAGSVLTMHQAMTNMVNLADTSLEDAILMATYNPALKLNMTNKLGQITSGADASLLVLDSTTLDIKTAIHQGKLRG
ncbi:N-acetylglucosamine-6-phosphate deacetylase [Thiotrichales bacterium 19S9-12]|nr:N-acetylglucosamine-6-phosphate deacetylase [Thiotrichales bacterium 19S9-11]MCF6811358.1 N-acetylglucosamine-6-phosphate deacetylase [Thiotrichales bacterium 19S9-12]